MMMMMMMMMMMIMIMMMMYGPLRDAELIKNDNGLIPKLPIYHHPHH